MGGPILKKLADGATIQGGVAGNNGVNGEDTYYFFAGERKGPVRVYLRFDRIGSGDPNFSYTVLPVFPSLDGTATVPWPDWTGGTTLPYVVPDGGTHALGGAASSGEGCVFIAAEARVSQFKVTVTESANEDATYTLVAELI